MLLDSTRQVNLLPRVNTSKDYSGSDNVYKCFADQLLIYFTQTVHKKKIKENVTLNKISDTLVLIYSIVLCRIRIAKIINIFTDVCKNVKRRRNNLYIYFSLFKKCKTFLQQL